MNGKEIFLFWEEEEGCVIPVSSPARRARKSVPNRESGGWAVEERKGNRLVELFPITALSSEGQPRLRYINSAIVWALRTFS